MANVKEAWIKKYGEAEGLRMWEDRKRKSANTLDNYILKYGDATGKLKYDELQIKLKYRFTLPWFIDRYGAKKGPIKYKERNSKMSVGIESLRKRGFTEEQIADIKSRHSKGSAITLENQIKKYGEVEGRRRYEVTKEKVKLGSVRRLDYWIKKNNGNIEQAKIDLSNHQKRDLKFYIQKYGDVIGLEKFTTSNNKKGRTIENYITKYGNVIGLEKFNDACRKWKKGQKGIFNSKGQIEIEMWLRTIFSNVKGERNDTGIILLEHEKNEYVSNNVLYPDIIINDKYIINYNGDFWHANKSIFPDDDMINGRTRTTAGYIRRKDIERNDIYLRRGYSVVDIWESEWRIDPDKVKTKLLNIIL